MGIKGARRCQGDAARYDAAATKTGGSQGEKEMESNRRSRVKTNKRRGKAK